MEITKVSIILAHEERLKAYVTLRIDDCFLIRDIKIIQSDIKLFIAMPCRKHKDGEFRDICHPLNQSTRDKIEKAILSEYIKATGNKKNGD